MVVKVGGMVLEVAKAEVEADSVEAKNSPAKLLGTMERQFFTVPSVSQDYPHRSGTTADDLYPTADPLNF